jgi:5,10-methylene-tetrahydrofolate dehydrogenase/methenyl tetrahydrofolate cyclohydrolase
VLVDVGASRADYRHPRRDTGSYVILGDIHPDTLARASMFTPVPGGVCLPEELSRRSVDGGGRLGR